MDIANEAGLKSLQDSPVLVLTGTADLLAVKTTSQLPFGNKFSFLQNSFAVEKQELPDEFSSNFSLFSCSFKGRFMFALARYLY